MATSDECNQSLCSKSWVEIMEEEEIEKERQNSLVSTKSPLLRDSTNTQHTDGSRVTIKEEPVLDETACDINITNDAKDIKIEPSDVLPNFSVSHVKTTTDSIKENSSTKCIKTETKEFLHEDLSISSHLNIFQIVSPCKTEHKTPTKAPTRSSVSYFLNKNERKDGTLSPSHLTKRKLEGDESKGIISDDMLMPSPSKIRKQNTPKQNLHTPTKNKRTPKSNNKNTPKQGTPLLNFTPTGRNLRKRSREQTPGKRLVL